MKADRHFLSDQATGAPRDREPLTGLCSVQGDPGRLGPAGAVWLSLISVLVAGCAADPVHYKLTPPTTPEGKACIETCEEQRKACVERQQNQFYVCQSGYREAMAIYTRCRNSSLGPTPGSQFSCDIPRACTPASPEPCDEPYRACFETCGGKLEPMSAP